jgi:phospholipase C
MQLKKTLLSCASAVAFALTSHAASADSRESLRSIKNIVVIYQENHSFDNLYGLWGDVWGDPVNGLGYADLAHTTQVQQDNVTAYLCLLQNDVNLKSPPLPAPCTDSGGAPVISSDFLNQPFKIDNFIASTDKTCPPPSVFAPNGVLKDSAGALAGGCTRDIVHRFYSEQYQINKGKQNRYVTGSDAAGLTMGYYDTKGLPIYKYLHRHGAPHYVIADSFFQGSFGGSFLNHQWFIAAATPIFANAVQDGTSADLHSIVDANGMPTATPL